MCKAPNLVVRFAIRSHVDLHHIRAKRKKRTHTMRVHYGYIGSVGDNRIYYNLTLDTFN